MCYETAGLKPSKRPKIRKRMIYNAIISEESQLMTTNSISLVILLLVGVEFFEILSEFLK